MKIFFKKTLNLVMRALSASILGFG